MQRNKPLIWTDTHISPSIAKWLNEEFDVEAMSFYKLGFHTTSDHDIFMAAKKQNAIFLTKDKDYKNLIDVYKPPPAIIFLRRGNISNSDLKLLLQKSMQKALDLILKHNHYFIEIE